MRSDEKVFSLYSADRVGPYRFIRTLGRGAEGVVKLAINTEDESGGYEALSY